MTPPTPTNPSYPFSSEGEMQQWLEDELQSCYGLNELLVDTEYLDNLIPVTELQQRVLSSYSICLESLGVNDPISFDENVSLFAGSTLRPDGVFYAPETQSIVVLELKNSKTPTREAGTELAAYSAALRAYIPSISDADIVFMLISTEWPVLLRQYALNEMFWGHRNVICLRPIKSEDGIRLAPLPYEELEIELSTDRIAEQHLGGFHICLQDYSSDAAERLDAFMPNMMSAMQAMAAKGEHLRCHGFCLLSSVSGSNAVAPYIITVVQFAPFRTLERLLKGNVHNLETYLKLIEIVQEYDPTGQSNSFLRIVDAGTPFLKPWSSPVPECFTDWSSLRRQIGSASAIRYFQGWGVFGERYRAALIDRSRSGPIDELKIGPMIGIQVLDGLIDTSYKFISLDLIDLDDISSKLLSSPSDISSPNSEMQNDIQTQDRRSLSSVDGCEDNPDGYYHKNPPNQCDLCGGVLGNVFFDAKTYFGSWATQCESCFQRSNGKVGWGHGQKYVLTVSSRWLLIEGKPRSQDG